MVAQINALEEQLNSAVLKQAAAATAREAAETNTTDSDSAAGFSTPLRGKKLSFLVNSLLFFFFFLCDERVGWITVNGVAAVVVENLQDAGIDRDGLRTLDGNVI